MLALISLILSVKSAPSMDCFGVMVIRHKFFYLLLALLAFFVLNPFLANVHAGTYIFGLLFTLLLFFSVLAIRRNRYVIFSAITLALVVLVGIWVSTLIQPHPIFLLAEAVVELVFFSLITVVILSYVMEEKIVNFGTLCGAICGYLLIGLSWSFIYLITYLLSSDSFNITVAINNELRSSIQSFIYYSFVTLTTLGYGDITPLSNVSRTFSWLEALTGQIYLTVWIAQLIALHILYKTRRKS